MPTAWGGRGLNCHSDGSKYVVLSVLVLFQVNIIIISAACVYCVQDVNRRSKSIFGQSVNTAIIRGVISCLLVRRWDILKWWARSPWAGSSNAGYSMTNQWTSPCYPIGELAIQWAPASDAAWVTSELIAVTYKKFFLASWKLVYTETHLVSSRLQYLR